MPSPWISLSSIGNHERQHVGTLISIFVKWSWKPASSYTLRTGFYSIPNYVNTNRQSHYPRPKSSSLFLNIWKPRPSVRLQENQHTDHVISIIRVRNGPGRVVVIIDGSWHWDENWHGNTDFDLIKYIHVKHMWNGCMPICRQPFNVIRNAHLSWRWLPNIRFPRIRLYPTDIITEHQSQSGVWFIIQNVTNRIGWIDKIKIFYIKNGIGITSI